MGIWGAKTSSRGRSAKEVEGRAREVDGRRSVTEQKVGVVI